MIPSIGRIVHYVLADVDTRKGEHRAAIIVNVFDKVPTDESVVNLQVFTDERNDVMQAHAWRTSVHQDPTGLIPGTWHEPEHAAAPGPEVAPG